MNIYEKFPDVEEPRTLTEAEIAEFAKANIWPAATYFWGNSYRDPEKLNENETVILNAASPTGENKLEVGFYVDAEFPLDDKGEVDEHEPTDLYVGAYM